MSQGEPIWRRYARFLRDDPARDVDDELAFHVDRLVADELAAGHDRAEAERRAAERMGDLARARTESRRIRRRGLQRRERSVHFAGLGRDLFYTARSLRGTPLFTVVAALTLALGIGANTAVFSVLDHVALRPLPYRDPDRLVAIWEHNVVRQRPRNVVNPQNALDWRARARSFQSFAIFTFSGLTFTGGGDAERVEGRLVTSNFFDVLGVRPLLGRTFTPADSTAGAPRTLVLSHGLWRRRFGGDSTIVGRMVTTAGSQALVIGVMPERFRPTADEEFWEPVPIGPAVQRRGRLAMVIARLADGVTPAQAAAEMRAIARDLEREYPDFNTGWTVDVTPLLDDVVGEAGRKLTLALGAVALVLLIACANVGNLILVRAAARRHEMAVRTALGAARARLARLWLAECGLLTLLGVAMGLAVAWLAVRGIVTLAPPDIPRLDDVRLDARIFAFTGAVAAAVALALGLGAAVGSAPSAADSLRAADGRLTASVRARRFRSGLVVVQVALALVLLHGAGLLIRTLGNVQRVSPGFDPAQLATATVGLPGALYREPAQWTAFFRRATEALRAQPGVVEAGFINAMPLTGIGYATAFRALDRAEPPRGQMPVADIRVADEGYFRALRLPVLAGRALTPRDDSLPLVMVNATLASQLWPGGSALGQRLQVHWNDPDRFVTIVGVIRDTPSEGLDRRPRPTIYYAPEGSPASGYTLVVRSAVDPASMRGVFQRVIRQLDPSIAVRNVATMRQTVERSLAARRSPAFLLGLFAALALVIATVGLYGVLAYAVGLRTKEIGVRVALGARPTAVMWLVVRGGLALGGLGVAIGAAAALAATSALRDLLFGLEPTDLATFAGVAALLLAGSVVASWIPAWRASRVDPTEVIRAE
jgi:putative ABC transport system permease protein